MQYHNLLFATAALLTAAAAMPAALQPQLLQHRPITKKLPGSMNPANNVQRIVHLSHVPGSMVSIDTDTRSCDLHTYPTSPHGIVAFDGTLYVLNDCQGEGHINFIDPDRIDLTPVFAHGFRIDHVTIEDLEAGTRTETWQKQVGRISLTGSTGYSLTATRTLVTASMAAPWNATSGRRFLEIAPTRYEKAFNGTIRQVAHYRVDVYLVGPASVNPYTGRTITRPAIN